MCAAQKAKEDAKKAKEQAKKAKGSGAPPESSDAAAENVTTSNATTVCCASRLRYSCRHEGQSRVC